MEADKWGQGADVTASVTGPNGESVGATTGKIDPSTRGALLNVPIASGATGPWRVTAQVASGSERLEGRTTIESVPTGRLLGNPVVYRAAPGPRAPLRPAAPLPFHAPE